jgi:hypothetical protein
MLGWDTFRITFRDVRNYAIFGIVVPESFDVDPDCLQELGFTLGYLEELTDSVIAELPLRFCYARKLNQTRAASAFSRYYRANAGCAPSTVLAEFRNRKERKVSFVKPVSDGTGFWAPPIG